LLLKQIPNSETKDFWDDLPIRIREDIEAAIKKAESGQLISHAQVMSEVKLKYL